MNVIGFDDAPFAREHRGDVLLVGAVCAGTRLDGVLCGRVRRDGVNATERMLSLILESPFRKSIGAIFLQGIAVAGFNVVDVHRLAYEAGVPALVVIRRRPDFSAIRRALGAVEGAERKWQLIEAAGEVEELALPGGRARGPSGLPGSGQRIYVQRAGLSIGDARALVRATTLHGQVPEPLRLAHLIAGGVGSGQSRGRT